MITKFNNLNTDFYLLKILANFKLYSHLEDEAC